MMSSSIPAKFWTGTGRVAAHVDGGLVMSGPATPAAAANALAASQASRCAMAEPFECPVT